MVYSITRISFFLSLIFLVFNLAACGDAANNATEIKNDSTKLPTESAAKLLTIQLSPNNPVVSLDTTLQMTAIGIYSNNTKANISDRVTWQSLDATTVSFAGSLVTRSGYIAGEREGQVSVRASLEGIDSSYVKVKVINSPLQSIEITPKHPQNLILAAHIKQTFTATGYYEDDSSQDLSEQVEWISLDNNIASFTESVQINVLQTQGIAGTARILAQYNGTTSNTISYFVGQQTLSTLQVQPQNFVMAPGTHQKFFATAIQDDSSSQELTTNVIWQSSAPEVAEISNAFGNEGLVTAVTPGSAIISARFNEQTIAFVALEVTDMAITEIQVSSPLLTGNTTPEKFAKGTIGHFHAVAVYEDKNTTQDITNDVVWRSRTSDQVVRLFIDSARGYAGYAVPILVGPTAISASFNGVSSNLVELEITDDTLQTISITPAEINMLPGESHQLAATGHYVSSNGQTTTQDISDAVRWISSDDSVITVEPRDTHGALATAIGFGEAISVNAILVIPNVGVIASTAAIINVVDSELTTISIVAAETSIALGDSTTYIAQGEYINRLTSTQYSQDITELVTWLSTDENIATANNTSGLRGEIQSKAMGTTTITASLGSLNVSTSLTVTDAIIRSLSTTPVSAAIQTGNNQTFSAKATYSDGTVVDKSNIVTWKSDNPTVASITNDGVATAINKGVAIISASFVNLANERIESQSELTITTIAPVLAIVSGTSSVIQGNNLQLDTSGGTGPFIWSVDNNNASINRDSGLLTGLNPGPVLVKVVDSNNNSDTLMLDIVNTPIVLQTIDITPSVKYLESGLQQPYRAMGNYSGQASVDITDRVTWSSSDNSVVTFSNNTAGLAQAKLPNTGTVTITATSADNTVSAVATLHIQAPVINVTSSSRTFSINSTAQFTASGGIGPYSWGLSNNSAGIATIDSSGLLSISGNSGIFDVIATDSRGFIGIATITVTTNIAITGLFPDPSLQACVEKSAVPTTDLVINISCWSQSPKIRSLEGLQHLKNLRSLDLTNNNITDISPLADLLNLGTLILNNNNLGAAASDKIIDYNALSKLSNLTYLSLNSARIDAQTDISRFNGLTNLITLSMYGNSTTAANMMAIAGLTNIENLNIPALGLDNIAFVSRLTKIRTLDLSANKLTSIAEIRNLPNITSLFLSGNQITDVSPLSALSDVNGVGTIQFLKLDGNANLDTALFNQTFDTPYAYSALTFFNVNNSGLTSITSLGNLTGLKTLLLQNNAITDITPISTLASLTDLDLYGNYLTDISGVEGATTLIKLNLSSNPRINPNDPAAPRGSLTTASLASLSPLLALQHLQLNNTGISDLTSLATLQSLIALNMRGNKIEDVTPLASLVTLTYLNLVGNTAVLGLLNINSLNSLSNAVTIDLSSNPSMSCAELIALQTDLNTNSAVVRPSTAISSGTGVNCSLP